MLTGPQWLVHLDLTHLLRDADGISIDHSTVSDIFDREVLTPDVSLVH